MNKKKYSAEEGLYLQKISDRIRTLRQEGGYSQESFAYECELDRTYIGSVERGERNISAINLRKIAMTLGIEVSELLKFEA